MPCLIRLPSVANEFYERTAGLILGKEDDKARLEVQCYAENDLDVYQARNTPVVESANGTAEPLSGLSDQKEYQKRCHVH